MPSDFGPHVGIVAAGLRAGYPSRLVLQNVSIELRPGDVTGIIGPNGAGKSTLLKALAGSLNPESGSITVDGASIRSFAPRDLARKIAVVPQTLHIGFGLTALEVVTLGRTPYFGFLGSPNADDRDAIAEALDDTDTAGIARRPFASLSGGEAQRVILAMALAQGTPYLLLDEPTVHLDLGQQWHFLSRLFELRARRQVGILAVVHDLTLAGTIFERIVMLESGRVIADGRPSEVLTMENVQKGFRAPVTVWQDDQGVRVGMPRPGATTT